MHRVYIDLALGVKLKARLPWILTAGYVIIGALQSRRLPIFGMGCPSIYFPSLARPTLLLNLFPFSFFFSITKYPPQ
jgi:hypothetical protein